MLPFRAMNITPVCLFILASCHVGLATEFLANRTDDYISDGGDECIARGKIGLALNGGGFIAAAGGAAIMRGFQQQTITICGEERPAMEAFDYISGLSGGTIPTMLYVYAQNVDTNQLLDADFRISDPSQITRAALQRKRKQSIFSVLERSVSKRLIPLFLYYLTNFMPQKGVWPLVTWLSFLRPFGVSRNQHFGSSIEKNVVSPRDGVKAEPLISFALVGEAEDYGLDFTERLLATMKELNGMDLSGEFTTQLQIQEAKEKVGNITFLPYITSSSEVGTEYSVPMRTETGEFQPFGTLVKPSEWGSNKNRFSLELALGMATNFASYVALGTENARLVSIVNKFSQQRKTKFGSNVEKNMLFADGGFIHGTDIPSMIKRNVSKIIAPIWVPETENSYAEIHNKTKGRPLSEWAMSGYISDSISNFFGLYGGRTAYISQIFMMMGKFIFRACERHLMNFSWQTSHL